MNEIVRGWDGCVFLKEKRSGRHIAIPFLHNDNLYVLSIIYFSDYTNQASHEVIPRYQYILKYPSKVLVENIISSSNIHAMVQHSSSSIIQHDTRDGSEISQGSKRHSLDEQPTSQAHSSQQVEEGAIRRIF